MTTYYEMPFKTLKTVQFLITINMHAENLASIAEAMMLLQVSEVNCPLGLFATHHGLI